MLNYATIGSNKLDASLQFYDALLGSIGLKTLFDHPRGGRIYGGQGCMFGVLKPFDEQPAAAGNGAMSGFALDSRSQVDAFHAKALELGGSCDGAPALRGPDELGYYFAYVRDLDGNKLCAYRIGRE